MAFHFVAFDQIIPNISGLPIFPQYGSSFCGHDHSFSTLVALPLFFSQHGLSFVAFDHSFSRLVVVKKNLAIVRNAFFFHFFVDFLLICSLAFSDFLGD